MALLVTDISLAGPASGLDLVDFVNGRNPNLQIFVVSGSQRPPLPANVRFFGKPVSPGDIVRASQA